MPQRWYGYDGLDLVILATGKSKKLLAEINLGNAIYTAPVARDGVLYVLTSSRLIALGAKPQ